MGRREAWANLGACHLGSYLWGLAELRLWEQPQQCEREGLKENNGGGQEGGVTLPTGALARNETDEMVVGPRLGVPVTTDGRPFLRVLPAWRVCLKFCFFIYFPTPDQ